MQEKNNQTCSFSARLNLAISAKGLQKKEFASRLGVLPGSISRYSTGKHLPSAEEMYRMAKILDVSMDWLMGEDEKISNAANYWKHRAEEAEAKLASFRAGMKTLSKTVSSLSNLMTD